MPRRSPRTLPFTAFLFRVVFPCPIAWEISTTCKVLAELLSGAEVRRGGSKCCSNQVVSAAESAPAYMSTWLPLSRTACLRRPWDVKPWVAHSRSTGRGWAAVFSAVCPRP